MPAVVWVLIGLFTLVSLTAGTLAAWLVGPRRRWTPILPFLGAFGALYALGHRGISVGPGLLIFGFEISLLFDVAVALAAAFGVAFAQRAAWWIGRRRARGA